MSNIEFNYRKDRKIPINRNNLFYSEDEYQFEMDIASDYLAHDLNQTIVLYEVDLNKSNLDSIYNETKKDALVFKTPVELHCTYNIEPGEIKGYDKTKNMGIYVKQGKITVNIFQKTLDEANADIKIGDYLAVNINGDAKSMLYFCVNDDGRNNFDNRKSVFGYKNPWRKIIAAATTLENTEFQ